MSGWHYPQSNVLRDGKLGKLSFYVYNQHVTTLFSAQAVLFCLESMQTQVLHCIPALSCHSEENRSIPHKKCVLCPSADYEFEVDLASSVPVLCRLETVLIHS